MAKFEQRLLYLQAIDRLFMNSAEFIIDVKVKYRVTLVMVVMLWLCIATNGSCRHKQTILLIHKSVH